MPLLEIIQARQISALDPTGRGRDDTVDQFALMLENPLSGGSLAGWSPRNARETQFTFNLSGKAKTVLRTGRNMTLHP